MALISGRMTYSSLYVTAFPIGPLLGMLSYSIEGEETGSWEILHLYHEEPVGSFVWWGFPIMKGNTWEKRHPRYEVPGHSWASWLLGVVPLGYPGGRSHGHS